MKMKYFKVFGVFVVISVVTMILLMMGNGIRELYFSGFTLHLETLHEKDDGVLKQITPALRKHNKIILAWTNHYNQPFQKVDFDQCPVKHCEMVYEHSLLQNADVCHPGPRA